tara:strand:- start:259 stop:423 length:165 start_codon:yes stop_codon:yes gene_type:complete
MLNEKIDQELSDDELKDASGGLKTVGENTQLNIIILIVGILCLIAGQTILGTFS